MPISDTNFLNKSSEYDRYTTSFVKAKFKVFKGKVFSPTIINHCGDGSVNVSGQITNPHDDGHLWSYTINVNENQSTVHVHMTINGAEVLVAPVGDTCPKWDFSCIATPEQIEENVHRFNRARLNFLYPNRNKRK